MGTYFYTFPRSSNRFFLHPLHFLVAGDSQTACQGPPSVSPPSSCLPCSSRIPPSLRGSAPFCLPGNPQRLTMRRSNRVVPVERWGATRILSAYSSTPRYWQYPQCSSFAFVPRGSTVSNYHKSIPAPIVAKLEGESPKTWAMLLGLGVGAACATIYWNYLCHCSDDSIAVRFAPPPLRAL